VLQVDRAAVDALNAIDESITFATLPAFAPVAAGEMVATVKIIPFAVASDILDRALAGVANPPVAVARFQPKTVAVISTVLPGLKDSVIAKTLRVMQDRLAPAGGRIGLDLRVPHETNALAAAISEAASAGADLTVIFGASAIADRRDIIPAAIEAAGGQVEHFGMPVDPGNLLLLGRLDGRPVLGAPGCARSPKENGFDWVLHRLLADLPVMRGDLTGFGVGGLLKEIVTRPQPRSGVVETKGVPNVAALVLAAGRSTRMRGSNKLLQRLDGKPLARIAVEEALASQASSVFVVTGHQAEEVEAALSGLPVTFVRNPTFADGLATSVRAGIAALPAAVDAAIVCLGDMPDVDHALIDAVIAAFDPDKGALIVVPHVAGRRGNPVLWARRFFPELASLEGDSGGRTIIDQHGDAAIEVQVAGDAAAFDIDTPESLAERRARSSPA
jgi:molybdenum cofactor cytidylyltransferase